MLLNRIKRALSRSMPTASSRMQGISSSRSRPRAFVQGWTIPTHLVDRCIDSTAAPEAVFAQEVKKLREEKFKVRCCCVLYFTA
jgi:hypothetical protein